LLGEGPTGDYYAPRWLVKSAARLEVDRPHGRIARCLEQMYSTPIVALIVAAALWILWFQIAASVVVLTDSTLSTTQRIGQCAMLWLVPVKRVYRQFRYRLHPQLQQVLDRLPRASGSRWSVIKA
jgi:hypothetical protein